MNYKNLAQHFDHTLLKPNATEADIAELCAEANNYRFASVCVHLCNVEYAVKKLDASVAVCTVIDFPFGAATPESKLFQLKEAQRVGAREADVLINIGRLCAGDGAYCIKELTALADFAHAHDMLLKVIVETSYLNEARIKLACEAVEASGADFIKTSTGYASRGASFEDIVLFKKYLRGKTKIKAAGGIRSLDAVLKYLSLGCERIGSSNAVSIMNEAYAQGVIA